MRALELGDPDYVAVPLTRAELERAVEWFSATEEPNHEERSLELKFRGALSELPAARKAK